MPPFFLFRKPDLIPLYLLFITIFLSKFKLSPTAYYSPQSIVHRTYDRGQKTDDRGQKTDDRGQKTEARKRGSSEVLKSGSGVLDVYLNFL